MYHNMNRKPGWYSVKENEEQDTFEEEDIEEILENEFIMKEDEDFFEPGSLFDSVSDGS